MSQSYEPHRLVIQHLSVLESAPAIVYEVEKRVFSAIDEKIKDWVESQGDWEGVFDYLESDTFFKPMSWENDEKGDYNAYYAPGPEIDEDYTHSLSPLIAAVSVRYGIRFIIDTNWVTRRAARPGAAWKNFLAAQFPLTKLAEYGFELQGESLFMPIRVDAQLLADDFPDSIGDALTPLDEALKKLEAAHPEIDALLKAALAYQFGKPTPLAGDA